MRHTLGDTKPGRALLVVQILTSVVAIIALALTIPRLSDVQTSRSNAAEDSCYLLRGLVHAATTSAPQQRKASQAYINRTPLKNCKIYAKDLAK